MRLLSSCRGPYACWWASRGGVTRVTLSAGTGDKGVGVVSAKVWLSERMEVRRDLEDKVVADAL